jgi:hypothetical protein
MPMRRLPYVRDKTGTILILHQVYIRGETLFNHFNKLQSKQGVLIEDDPTEG